MSGQGSRMAAVVFTDLVGSTALLSRVGEVAFDELRRNHMSTLDRAIRRSGGQQVKSIGDGILAVFGSAAAAVDCAVAIQQSVELEGRGGIPLAVRVGVAVGDVVFEEGDVHGVPVVEAARVTAAAKGGQILVTSVVRAVAGGRSTATFSDVGCLELKGLPVPVAACEVGWEPVASPSPETPTGRSARRLVGREHVVREVQGLLERAAAGAGGLLVLSGPAGSGKTTMADASVEEARRRGFEVVRATADRRHPGRFVWAQLLRDVGAPDDVAARLLDGPRLLELDSAAKVLVAGTRRLIVVDDLDRGGPEALELLRILAARVVASPTAVVATAAAPLGAGHDLRLEGLTEEEVAAMFPDLREAARHALWVASRGMPAIARALAEDLDRLGEEADPVVHLALHSTSRVEYLGVDVGLVRLLEVALARTPDEATRARLLARLAHELLGDSSAGARRRLLVDEALDLARRAGDRRTLAEVLHARLHAVWDPAAADDRLASASEIVDLARTVGDERHERDGLFWRFIALTELGRVAEAESALAAFARAAADAGDAKALVMVTARHAMLATLRGRFDEAARLIDEVATRGREAGRTDTDDLVRTLSGALSTERDSSNWPGRIDRQLAISRQRPGHYFEASAAALLHGLGRDAEASAELERLLPRLLQGSGPSWLGAVAKLAVVAAGTGDSGASRRLHAALLPYRGRLVVWSGANIVERPVSHYLGLLTTQLGELDDAVRHLEDAITLEEQIGALPSLADSLHALAEALTLRRGSGDPGVAAEHRRRARSIAERLGMTVLLERLSRAEPEPS